MFSKLKKLINVKDFTKPAKVEEAVSPADGGKKLGGGGITTEASVPAMTAEQVFEKSGIYPLMCDHLRSIGHAGKVPDNSKKAEKAFLDRWGTLSRDEQSLLEEYVSTKKFNEFVKVWDSLQMVLAKSVTGGGN